MSKAIIMSQADMIQNFGEHYFRKVNSGYGNWDYNCHLLHEKVVDLPSDFEESVSVWMPQIKLIAGIQPSQRRISKKLLKPISEQEVSFYETKFDNKIKFLETRFPKITYKSGEGKYNYIHYTSDAGYGVEFYIWPNPTSNCQVFSIGCFANLLNYCDLEETKKLLDATFSMGLTTGKRLMIFDVKLGYENKIKALNPIHVHPYESTNGSQMLHGMLKLF